MSFVKRSENIIYYGVKGDSDIVTYHRCKGFTDGSKAKNAKEYTRQYIDKAVEDNDVIAYSPSIAFSFDRIKGNPVHDDIIAIANEEKVWDDAIREIVVVDMASKDVENKVKGIARKYAVVMDADGIGVEVLQYTGNFKVKGDKEENMYTSSDNFETITKVLPKE